MPKFIVYATVGGYFEIEAPDVDAALEIAWQRADNEERLDKETFIDIDPTSVEEYEGD